MKNYWIVSLIVGLIALFFFPEPETNFLWYSITGIFFLVLTIVLFKKFRA
ncbi:hypothetical protein HOD88_03365 [archaeon]|jgi:hypothetical protein|nr:hypothetical protein [archaeon]